MSSYRLGFFGPIAIWLLVVLAPTGAVGQAQAQAEDAGADWPVTEGAAGGGRYSPLADIHRGNVGQLVEVWRYRYGDLKTSRRPDGVNRSTAMESTPIVVDGRLFFTTPFNRVIALDPSNGSESWSFDPEIDISRFFANMIINRGVAWWRDSERTGGSCARRVFLATLDARLIALDAATGRPCPDFGVAGEVDLLKDLSPVEDAWEYNVTSPPTVVGDVVVVGSSIADTVRRVTPPGDVRAFDARSGALRWTFHTIPKPGEPGHETWENGSWRESGSANVWTTMTADLERGWVFLPVSTVSPDFYGGDRPGANLFSDSLVAVDAATGRRVWHFQTVHHDIWDYDLPAPPNLVQVMRDGRLRDAVAQVTKTGFVFVLDRQTGKPLFPVEERPVPASDVPGERAWPTQPFPLKPPPLVPQHMTEASLWDAAPRGGGPGHLRECREWLAGLRSEGVYTPPSLGGTIIYPSNGGGANWSGAAWDPQRRKLVVPVNNVAHVVKLKPVWGSDSNLQNRAAQPMRSYLRAAWFLISGRGTGLRYITHPLTGRVGFEIDGEPCNAPPWGELVSVDLDSGEIDWRAPTGEKDGVRGLFSYGPPLATAGGLVFHSGNADERLRVHDSQSGQLLTAFALPAGLHAGPISYRAGAKGRQLIVVAPGGHAGQRTTPGDYVIAYGLPE